MSEIPRGTSQWGKIGIAVGLLMAMGIIDKVAAETQQRVEQASEKNRIKFVQDMVLDDLINAAQGNESVTPRSKALHNLNITSTVTAKTLTKDYSDNEVAADQKYKNKSSYFLVSGAIDSISKDFTGTPYVSLRGNEMFHNVQARFSDGAVDILATLKKGQTVSFVCTVSGLVVAQVMLRNCETLDSHARNSGVRAPLDQFVADVFAGKKKVSKEMADTMATLYVFSKYLSQDSPCFSNPIATTVSHDCEQQFLAVVKSATKSAAKTNLALLELKKELEDTVLKIVEQQP